MSFLCCCCNNKSKKLTISNHEENPAKTIGTFVQKQVRIYYVFTNKNEMKNENKIIFDKKNIISAG